MVCGRSFDACTNVFPALPTYIYKYFIYICAPNFIVLNSKTMINMKATNSKTCD